MIAFALLAAAATQSLAMPDNFRGRWLCELATRREQPSEITLWLHEGKASTAGDEAAKLPAVRDATWTKAQSVTKDDMTMQPSQFRSGQAEVLLKAYSRARFYSWMHLTVIADADEKNALPRETASGFCLRVVPSTPK